MAYKIDWITESIIYTNEKKNSYTNFADAKNHMLKLLRIEITNSVGLYNKIKNLSAADVKTTDSY